jgi:hypothetical protein
LTALTTLPALAEQINQASAAAEANAKSAMQHALRAGRLLIEAKALTTHGDWENWLTANCTMAPRTAQAYMRLAKKLQELPADEAQRVADLPVREAIRAIATSPEAPARASMIRINDRTDADRAASTFKKGAAAMRDAAKWANVGKLDAKRVQSLRAKLQAAVEELDRLAAVEVRA